MQINPTFYKELRGVLNSNIAIFEILFTYHSLKRTCRVKVPTSKLEVLQKICKENNLFLAIQDYKILGIPDKGKGGFTNKGTRVPIDDPNGKFVAYISNSQEEVFLAKEFEKKKDNMNFGNILGYPDCCVDFFSKNLEEQSKKQMDFIMPAANSLSQFPFVNNICLRYFGIALLSHFTCDFACEKSKAQGEAFLSLIREYNPSLASYYEKMLKSFVLYTEYDGVFYSPDYAFRDNVIHYKNIRGTEDNEMYALLKENNEIKCTSYNRFEINNKIFDNNAVIILFK